MIGARILVGCTSPDSEVPSTHSGVNEVSAVVAKLLTPYSYQAPSEEHRTVKYASRYRLAFTLLNEDASSGQGALSWDVNEAIYGDCRNIILSMFYPILREDVKVTGHPRFADV